MAAQRAEVVHDAEGFGNERIEELARAFVARGEDADDDFTAWALGQGRFP